VAQNITVDLQDDLDGGPADETVRFGVDSAEYEIDLSKKNAAAFRHKVGPFIDHARKARRAQRRRLGRTTASAPYGPFSDPAGTPASEATVHAALAKASQ
jgi:Lsr2